MTGTSQEQETYHSTLEDRCKHLEETIKSTIGFLRIIIHDFETPVLKSLFDPITERLNSLIVFLEAASDSTPAPTPRPNGHYSIKE